MRKIHRAYEEMTISSGGQGHRERTGATRLFVEPENGRRLGAGLGYLPDQGGKAVGTGNHLLVGNLYADLTVGSVNLVGEFLFSRNENGAGAKRDADSHGFWIQPSYKFDEPWEAVVRYSFTASDGRGINLSDAVRNAPSGGTMNQVSDYYVGFTDYFVGNDLKVQAGYVYATAEDTVTSGAAEATTSDVRSQMQIQL